MDAVLADRVGTVRALIAGTGSSDGRSTVAVVLVGDPDVAPVTVTVDVLVEVEELPQATASRPVAISAAERTWTVRIISAPSLGATVQTRAPDG